jgi:hypothetical protein
VLITGNSYPGNGGKGVAVDTHIYLPFNEEIDKAAITPENIVIREKKKPSHQIKYTIIDNPEPVREGQYILDIDPESQFKYGLEYEVEVSGLQDISGEVMTGKEVIGFKANRNGKMIEKDIGPGSHIRDIGVKAKNEGGEVVYVLKSEDYGEFDEYYYLERFEEEGGEITAAGEPRRLREYPSDRRSIQHPKYTRFALSEEKTAVNGEEMTPGLVIEKGAYADYFESQEVARNTFRGDLHMYKTDGGYVLENVGGGYCKLPKYTGPYMVSINGGFGYVGLMSIENRGGSLGVINIGGEGWNYERCDIMEVDLRPADWPYSGGPTRPLRVITFNGTEVYAATYWEIVHLSAGGAIKNRISLKDMDLDEYMPYGMEVISYEEENAKRDVLYVASWHYLNGIKVMVFDVTNGEFNHITQTDEKGGQKDSLLIKSGMAYPSDDMLIADKTEKLGFLSGRDKIYFLDLKNPEKIRVLESKKNMGGRLALGSDGIVYAGLYYDNYLKGVPYKIGAYVDVMQKGERQEEVRISAGEEWGQYNIRLKLDERMEKDVNTLNLSLKTVDQNGMVIEEKEFTSFAFSPKEDGFYELDMPLIISPIPNDNQAGLYSLFGGEGTSGLAGPRTMT